MEKVFITTVTFLLAVVCVLSGVIINRETEGGDAHIQCHYDQGYETYQKYLSKGTYRDRVVVIQTQTHRHPAWTYKGRYSLYDDTERRVFTVTITNLVLEDSGTYWCGVNTWGPDQPTDVRLTVDRAPVPPKPGSVTSRPLLSTTHPSTNITMITDSSNSTAAPVPPNPGSVTSRPLLSTTHPSTNITMTTDSSNSTTDRTNGTEGTTSPPTDMTRTQGNTSITTTDMTRTQDRQM
ncbi:CMRF35-like molecule 5 [Salvelinus alpinus]|uniref:CMRF35-like molecule 5 n=1 Tax=Salvelinus alpinus TaxID=8036 RepID=UPI0039FC02E7